MSLGGSLFARPLMSFHMIIGTINAAYASNVSVYILHTDKFIYFFTQTDNRIISSRLGKNLQSTPALVKAMLQLQFVKIAKLEQVRE
jgi:hypothetical protein